MAMRSLETDYLVVGAGAMGMAFTDALIDHADVHVTLVERRHASGGTGRTRIRSSSSTRPRCSTASRRPCSGGGTVQESGPEAGLQERARQSEIRAYYDDILHRRFLGSGQVTFLQGSEHHARRLRPPRDVAGVGRDPAGRRASPGRRRHLPLADHPCDHTCAVRGC